MRNSAYRCVHTTNSKLSPTPADIFIPLLFTRSADIRIVSETSRADSSALSSSNTPWWENLVQVKSGAFGEQKAYRLGEYNRHHRKLMHKSRSLLSWLGFRV